MLRTTMPAAVLGMVLLAGPAEASDADGDGVPDPQDNCPELANPGQADADGDFFGDLCDPCPTEARDDGDGDGLCPGVDNCPGVANVDQADEDGDGIGDACDVCREFANPLPVDSNADGIPNACQCGDADGDGDIDYDDASIMYNCSVGATSCDKSIVDADGNGELDLSDLAAYLEHLEIDWFFGYELTGFVPAGDFVCGRRPDPVEHRVPVALGLGGGVVHGSLRGSEEDVVSFTGIPYAAPPEPDGSSRWRPPAPHPGFGGAVVDASVQRGGAYVPELHCPQRLPFVGLIGREDCQRLFVWAPRDLTDADDRRVHRPVAVWIHGGGLVAQNGRKNFAELVRRLDAVVVSLNYRLGVFGFLANPELQAESPQGAAGNYALLDLTLGLQWVQENIHRFGGDPDRVMIFGNSGGGSAVSLLMASPLAEGLFRSVLSTSGALMTGPLPELPATPGGAPVPSPILRHPFERAAHIAADPGVDCSGGGGFASELACLRAADPHDLVVAGEGQTHKVLPDAGIAEFFPVVDHYVLTQQPAEYLATGGASDVTLVIGAAADEGLSFNGTLPGLTPTQWRDRLEVVADGDENLADLLELVYDPVALGLAADDAGRKQAYDTLSGELTFICPSLRFARAAVQAPDRTAPVYRFLHEHVMRDRAENPLKGALHNHPIAYMLGQIENMGPLLAGGPVHLNSEDFDLEGVMHDAFRQLLYDAEVQLEAPQPSWLQPTPDIWGDEDTMIFDGYAPGLDTGVVARAAPPPPQARCNALTWFGLME